MGEYAARVEVVVFYPDRIQGPLNTAPGCSTLPYLYYKQESNRGHVTNVTVSHLLPDRRSLRWTQRWKIYRAEHVHLTEQTWPG